METKFTPTEKQIAKWNTLAPASMPSDDEFKAAWKKAHHGKESGWGMGKRDWVVRHSDDHLTCTVEYNMGVWQGRVDAMRNAPRMETSQYHTNPYHYGYAHGFDSFEKFCKEFGAANLAEFKKIYGG